MAHAVQLALELHEPAVVHDAVDDRGRHLVVPDDPQRENSRFVVITTDCRS